MQLRKAYAKKSAVAALVGLTAAARAGLVVQWSGPSEAGGGDPVSGVDYTVSGAADNPDVVLITTEKLVAGVPDPVPVLRWFIGNEDTSGNPLDINSITTAWAASTQGPYDIRVEVGTAPRKCRHLGTLDIASEDNVQGTGHPTTWSSAILNLTGNLTGTLKVVSTAARLGGRVRGTIAGNQGSGGEIEPTDPRIEAQAVGEGDGTGTTTQTLRVSGQLWNVRVAEFPSNARLEANTIGTSSAPGLLSIKGPLNGTVRLRSFIGNGSGPQPNKITVESLDLSAADPDEADRKVSTGKLIVAGAADLSSDFFPCDQCSTSGWIGTGVWRNSELAIDGPFAGKVYIWSTELVSFNTWNAKVRIGQPNRPGNLQSGGEIRTFSGNHSSPPTQFAIDYVSIDIYGETELGSLIDLAGQMGQQAYVRIHDDHKGTMRAMYFYANQHGAGNAEVHVYGHCEGLIESVNLTDESHRSCFRDNGTITIDGDVKSTGQIRLTGHVGAAHLTEIWGDLGGLFYAYGGPQKKFAGRLRVHGDVLAGTAARIHISPSIDSTRFVDGSGSPAMSSGGRIDIDGDLNAGLSLLAVNDAPCLWLGPGDAPTDPELCEGPCTAAPNCTGLFPEESLDHESCCTSCSCQPPPNPPPPATQCFDQTMAVWEDLIQHPGALARGKVTISGKVTGFIQMSGDIGANGAIQIGTLEGSVFAMGIRAGGSLTVVNAFRSGAINVDGDVAGTITMGSLGPPTGGGSNQATISIGGELRSTITVRDQMHAALISVGTGATGSRINLGTSSTLWTVVDGPGGTGYIDIGDINWSGGSSTIITFRGSYTSPPSGMAAPRSICWGTPAGTVLQLFSGDPMPAAICLP